MSRVFVCGLGAVSPAGWGVAALREALDRGTPLPSQPLDRPGWDKPLRVRPVPPPAVRPAFLAEPRLRRASPISQYVAAAALEAAARLRENNQRPRFGIVLCLQSGCVQYSYRFFEEIQKDPATASPLLFPETVYAAPASHVAALLGGEPLAYTVVGDPAAFLQGLSLGVRWLEEKRVDACLVIGAEEINWLLADALWHFEHSAVLGCGAGAICLGLDPARSIGVELAAITDAHTYAADKSRRRAARAMREQLPPGSPAELLCDGIGDSPRADAPELAAWRDWSGPRLSPKRILGEGLMAAAAWQCVATCDAVAGGKFAAARLSLVGCNQQAIGARFAHDTPAP
jgi:3-oxoacyl-(acyl-carrier-protein) synthase